MKARKLLWGFVLLLLVSCGGGGGGGGGAPPGPSPAAGLWVGSTSNGRTIAGFILDDNTGYVLYSVSGVPSVIAGFAHGTGSASNGSYTSNNAKDFNLEVSAVTSGTISASYVPRQSLNGSFTTSGETLTFSALFDTDYDLTPSLAALAGTFVGQAASLGDLENVTVTIGANGSFSGVSSGGCSFSGTITPRSSGNVFNISITFGAAPCGLPGLTITGIAFFDTSDNSLTIAAPTPDRTDALIAVVAK